MPSHRISTSLGTLVAIALSILAPAALAHAQECAEGRVSTPATLGRCCWPGQSFSESLGRCSGAPACPPPFVAEGDACVPPYTAHYGLPEEWANAPPPADDLVQVPSSMRAPGTTTSPALAWPDEPRSLADAIVSPRLERGTDDGLLVAGLTALLGGYVGGFVLALADEAARNCQQFGPVSFGSVGCESWPYAFIPVVGGVLAGTVIERENACCRNVALGIGLGLPLAAIQGFGLALMTIALFGGAEHLVPGEIGGEHASVALTPYFTGTEGGTWLRVEL
ncbi:hypothetical protein [Sandaracinus amylolyticus]|uniref:Uncharacterized protein n=1 Tax=Sandaracinus amylolyticus TaxID=927083 RepID=A0A0F6W967_9BACT|nr:hypothetical protein [Sandaracinus amylolyticus]AKF10540.1 hypothetical protein DB32_007689 [Sandaracinus amylolyticus]